MTHSPEILDIWHRWRMIEHFGVADFCVSKVISAVGTLKGPAERSNYS